MTDVRGFARWELQLACFAAFHLTFGGCLVAAGIGHRRRAASRPMPRRWSARTLAGLGLITSWGVYAFTGYIAATSGHEVSTVVAGRPVGWFVLQLLAIALLLTTIPLGAAWYRERRVLQRSEHVRLALLLAGAMLFVPWASWWELFSP